MPEHSTSMSTTPPTGTARAGTGPIRTAPSGSVPPTTGATGPSTLTFAARRPGADDEDGSLVSEYGLIAVLGATITGVAISWAKGGAIATLLNVILRQVRALVGV